MIFNQINNRWHATGGYREVLIVAFPLILSTASWSIQHFVDRMFLSWYSAEAIAATMPAGMLHFALVSIFMGTAGYVNTFVAQYFGAQRFDRIGPALWQALYISIFGGLVILCFIPVAEPIFSLVGHDRIVQQYEVEYFRVICLGGGFFIASYALSGFFSGRGKTWPVMWVNTLATALNLVLDYAMIFGNWGFPEMGIRGAGYATVIAGAFSFLAFFMLLSSGANNKKYNVFGGWRPAPELFMRLLRFGFPSGIQFFIEMAGFAGFVLLIGRLGTTSLVATNIAMNINTLAFMPMMGCGMAISILVGQYIGAGRPDMAQKSAYSGFHMTLIYMLAIAAAYVLLPDIFVAPFAAKSDPEGFKEIYRFSVILLRFVAAYSIFDTMNIIFCSAIKGAGDTRFVMFVTVLLSFFGFLVPTYLAIAVFNFGLMVCWVLATIYVSSLGVAFYLRFLNGKWKAMRVIEQSP